MKAIFEVYNPYLGYWYTVADMQTYYLFTTILGYPGRCDKAEPEPDDRITNSDPGCDEGMPLAESLA